MRIMGIVAQGAALGGCALSSADITPAYVSPAAYHLELLDKAAVR
jgi:hypothetical protein